MNLLLINPWIVDFKAYDEWMRPMPFYRLLEKLHPDHHVTYIDCLKAQKKIKLHSTADFVSEKLEKPQCFQSIPRQYRRYGVLLSDFREQLKVTQKPDLVLIASLMTWWYPGIKLAVEEVKALWPDTPIVIGGIYAALLPAHAGIFGRVEKDIPSLIPDSSTHPRTFPDAALLRGVLPLRIWKGCPDSCSYCASRVLHNGGPVQEDTALNLDRLAAFIRSGGEDVVFYDDAPLYRFDEALGLFLSSARNRGLVARFHFPNGMHARMIDQEKAESLFQCGVKTVRLGFERMKSEKKIAPDAFRNAVHCLRQAGFKGKELGAYVMLGLEPGLESAYEAARFLNGEGIRIHVNQFAPVPGTPLYAEAVRKFPELEQEPLLQNDFTWIFTHGGFDWQAVRDFKLFVRELNGKTDNPDVF